MNDQPKKETIYLAGKITGDPDYRRKFCAGETQTQAQIASSCYGDSME